MEGQHWM